MQKKNATNGSLIYSVQPGDVPSAIMSEFCFYIQIILPCGIKCVQLCV